MEITYDRLSRDRLPFLRDAALASSQASSSFLVKQTRGNEACHHRVGFHGLVSRLLKRCPRKKPPCVVGIDLTGSEKRATGWAVMHGADAATKCIRTDRELIAETVKANPDLVSIDSPLSLLRRRNPRGAHLPEVRTCAQANGHLGLLVSASKHGDAHPARNQVGGELRKAGCKVIESYPGAAQDILGIPRKKASLEELKQGLFRAGITGDS